ncbi:MAG TPA: putative lipid II flippase FtsW [Trebonia sp.]|nr:putative lipid II flippase FtsW [Trebonia sp.]
MADGYADGAGAAQDPGLGVAGAVRRRVRALRELLDRPLTPYYLIVGITALLLSLGLVMVLSTGSYLDLTNGQSPYAGFIKQLVGVLVGIPVTWLVARASPRLIRAAAYPLLAVSVIGLVLTFVPGVSPPVNGASRWIPIGPIQFQPSELAKLALVLWGADLLARKEKLGLLADWRHMLVPLMPVTGVLALLVITGSDLGTTLIIVIIFLALLWVAGAPGRVFTLMLILMGLVVVLLIVTEPYRLDRFASFLNNNPTSQNSTSSTLCASNYQGCNGKIALGSGGFFGVGLGAGGEKWGYVPEDTSDFIFAIIGEELGLVGTLCVIALYGALAYAGVRVACRAQDTFSRLTVSAITIWIVMQAVVNMGAVIGVLPITGIPLPLVSAGLSSVLVTMVALGMLMSFARRQPGAREALAARGPSVSGHVLSWLGQGKRRLPAQLHKS